MSSKHNLGAAAAVLGLAWTSFAGTVSLAPSKDNTLYQSTIGNLSSGSGPELFVGATAGLAARRAVMSFDLSSIPAGSSITSVSLSMSVVQVPAGGGAPGTVGIHSLTTSWGEGTSNGSGAGDAATPGDATWIHRFFDTTSWTTPGGDFSAGTLASTSINGVGAYAWSSPSLIASVQGWLDNPASNFGWIFVGNESTARTARVYGSRENVDTSVQPALTITYAAIPEPALLGVVGLAIASLGRPRRS